MRTRKKERGEKDTKRKGQGKRGLKEKNC